MVTKIFGFTELAFESLYISAERGRVTPKNFIPAEKAAAACNDRNDDCESNDDYDYSNGNLDEIAKNLIE